MAGRCRELRDGGKGNNREEAPNLKETKAVRGLCSQAVRKKRGIYVLGADC
jgi:hypothetical protein